MEEGKVDFGIYELSYKKAGMKHDVRFSMSPPSLENAIKKAKLYCEKRNLRFIHCGEWLRDIDQMIAFEPDENWHGGEKAKEVKK